MAGYDRAAARRLSFEGGHQWGLVQLAAGGVWPVARKSRQQGLVLVIVLWIITLLTVMAASSAYSLRTETLLAAHAVAQAQARALAEAGVNYAALQVLRPRSGQDPGEAWPTDGSERSWQFGQGVLSIAVVDAAGKIDLNSADRNLLGGLLTAAGVAAEDLDKLLDAIEDWRDLDELRRPNGAEQEDYRAAGRPAGPKNAPFESIEELQQVLGLTPELYRQMAGSLTVFARQRGVSAAKAPAAVLTLLKALPGVDPQAVDDYLALRREHAAQGLPPPPPPPLGPYLSAEGGVAYHISATAQLDDVTVSVEAVISRDRQADQPYKLLAWREGL